MIQSRHLLTACCLLAMLLVLALASDVLAKKKGQKGNNGNNNKAKKQQIERSIKASQYSGQRAKAIGEAAQRSASISAYEAQLAQQQIETAKGHIANLESYIELSVSRLQQIEQDIIDAQEEDSRLRGALADVTAAEVNYDAMRRKILDSTAYQAAYQRALASGNKAEQLPRVRQMFLNQSEALSVAQSELEAAQKRLEQARMEVLGTNPEWTEAVNEVRTSKATLAEVKTALQNDLLGKTSASANYRDAAQAAATADFIQRRSQQAINALKKQKAKVNSQSSKKSGSKSGKKR